MPNNASFPDLARRRAFPTALIGQSMRSTSAPPVCLAGQSTRSTSAPPSRSMAQSRFIDPTDVDREQVQPSSGFNDYAGHDQDDDTWSEGGLSVASMASTSSVRSTSSSGSGSSSRLRPRAKPSRRRMDAEKDVNGNGNKESRRNRAGSEELKSKIGEDLTGALVSWELPKWGIASIEQDVARHRSLRNKWHASVRLVQVRFRCFPVLLRLFDRAV